VRYEKCSPGSSNLISAITLSIGAILVKLLRVEVGGLSGVLVFVRRCAHGHGGASVNLVNNSC
jgi:hypothetical protein